MGDNSTTIWNYGSPFYYGFPYGQTNPFTLDNLSRMSNGQTNPFTLDNLSRMSNGQTSPFISDYLSWMLKATPNASNNSKKFGSRLAKLFKADKNKNESEDGVAKDRLADTTKVIQGADAVISGVLNKPSNVAAADAGYDTATQLVSQASPIAGAIMTSAGTASDIMSALGIGTYDNSSKLDSFISSKWGLALKPFAAIGEQRSDKFSIDDDTRSILGGSYTGAYSDMEDAEENLSDKKYSGFSTRARKRANRIMDDLRQKQNTMSDIANEAKDQSDMVSAMSDIYNNTYLTDLAGGLSSIRLGKEGLKINEDINDGDSDFVATYSPVSTKTKKLVTEEPKKKEIKLFSEKINPEQAFKKFQTGGLMDAYIDVDLGKIMPEFKAVYIQAENKPESKNLIPDGALHKEKHHMDNADSLTKKGIPVVDDSGNQQAEIEKNEIIFSYEVTKELEKLYHIYYDTDTSIEIKDAACLQAGELLVKEILFNTDDRTGLIDSLKNGGKFSIFQNGGIVGKNKPSFDRWVVGVPEQYMYDLESAYNALPLEMLDKWKNAVTSDVLPEGADWHLPGIMQIDDDTYKFLKLGKTVKENPELQYEFKAYEERPDFVKEFEMVFSPEENRWYYKRRINL